MFITPVPDGEIAVPDGRVEVNGSGWELPRKQRQQAAKRGALTRLFSAPVSQSLKITTSADVLRLGYR